MSGAMTKIRGFHEAVAGATTQQRQEAPRLRHPEDADMIPEVHAAATRRPNRLATWSLGIIGAGLVIFVLAAAVIPVDQVIRTDGQVMASGQTLTVAHLYGGVVEDILVREGDEIMPGQVLIRIDNRDSEAALGETRARIAALAVRAARLGAEANGIDTVNFPRDVEAASPESASRERQLFRARRESFMSELKVLEEQRRRQEQELVLQEAVVATLEKKLAILRAKLGAKHGAVVNGIEIAQADVAPIDVPRPGPGQTVTITVVAGRPLKLAFAADDVKGREVVKDDLVLEFDNGGNVVLKEYMTAFGKLGEVRTTIIQPDGKHYAFSELLAPSAGRRGDRPATGTPGDVVIIQRPPAREKRTHRLTEEKPTALNFGFHQIAKSQVDKDGDLVLTFKDGAVLVLERYAALKDKGIDIYFAKGDKISLSDLASVAGLKDAGARLRKPHRARSGDVESLEILRLRRDIKDAEVELATEHLKVQRLQAAILEARQMHVDRENVFAAKARRDLNDTESEITRLKETLERLTLDVNRNEVRAPSRGIVKLLRVAAKGSIVKAGEPLVEITPIDQSLVIEGRVGSNDIAFVRIGQHALVKITSHNYAAFGGLEGNVIEIGPEAIDSPEKPGESYFRVKIRTTKSFLEQDGMRRPIGPGMTAQVSIKIASKSMLAYIFNPLPNAARAIKIDESLPGNSSRSSEPEGPSAESL